MSSCIDIEQGWTRSDKTLPPEKQVVLAMDSCGHVQRLKYYRRLWWFEDMSMYVYYVPVYWRALS